MAGNVLPFCGAAPCTDTDIIHPQLILNVDGCIAVCFVDLLRYSGAFTPEEAEE